MNNHCEDLLDILAQLDDGLITRDEAIEIMMNSRRELIKQALGEDND